MDKLKQILFGIDKYSNRNKFVLSLIGDNKITDIFVYRKPIQKMVKTFLNLTSLNEIEKNLKNSNYDDIFHLFMLIKIDNNLTVLIEKNEILNIVLTDIDIVNRIEKIGKINIDYNGTLTINQLLNNTLKKVGEYNYFNYDSRNLNCQRFILDILKSNNLFKNEYQNFIYQNPYEIYKNTGLLGSFNKVITNLGSTYKILKGEGLKKNIKMVKKMKMKL